MRGGSGRILKLRSCEWMLVAMLIAQSIAAFGFPLLSPISPASESGASWPCQNRPCGCLNFDLCWAGDCCCMTLEEKLLWAQDNAIEPPSHVRPLVEARQHRSSPPPALSCCEVKKPKKAPAIRWASGVCAKKCRNPGPDGPSSQSPTIPTARLLPSLVAAEPRLSFARAAFERPSYLPFSPPTPPPRIV